MTGRPDEPEQQGWPQYQPQQPYQPESPWQPSYPPGYGYQRANHSGATTSMVLGIVALACLPLAFMCCGITLPGMLTAPFAWVIGARAKREIDAQPGRYGNRGSAEAGVVMGIIGTVLGVLAVAAVVLFFGLLAYSVPDPVVGTNV